MDEDILFPGLSADDVNSLGLGPSSLPTDPTGSSGSDSSGLGSFFSVASQAAGLINTVKAPTVKANLNVKADPNQLRMIEVGAGVLVAIVMLFSFLKRK